MEMLISIPDSVLSLLKQRAATNGQTVTDYTSKLVADTVTSPTVDEVLAPFRKQVAESGMSDDELDDFLRGELEAHRYEKKAKRD